MIGWKWWAGLVAAVTGLLAIIFGKSRGPTKEERRLTQALQDEIKRRLREDASRDIEDIEREIMAERDALLSGGDDGFMERARKFAGKDDGSEEGSA